MCKVAIGASRFDFVLTNYLEKKPPLSSLDVYVYGSLWWTLVSGDVDELVGWMQGKQPSR